MSFNANPFNFIELNGEPVENLESTDFHARSIGTASTTSTLLRINKILPVDISGTSDTTSTEMSIVIRGLSTDITGSSTTDECLLRIDKSFIFNSNGISDTSTSNLGRHFRFIKDYTSGELEELTSNGVAYDYVEDTPIYPDGKITQLTIINLINMTSVLRRRIYTFPVEKPSIKNENLDTFFKIIYLYRSLNNVKSVLDKVGREAESRLKNDFGIYEYQTNSSGEYIEPVWYDTADRYYTNDGTWRTPVPGDRGYIRTNSTGIFLGKDGWWAYYKGRS